MHTLKSIYNKTFLPLHRLQWSNHLKKAYLSDWWKYASKKVDGTFETKLPFSERPSNWYTTAKSVQKYLQKSTTFARITLLCGCLFSIILVQIKYLVSPLMLEKWNNGPQLFDGHFPYSNILVNLTCMSMHELCFFHRCWDNRHGLKKKTFQIKSHFKFRVALSFWLSLNDW